MVKIKKTKKMYRRKSDILIIEVKEDIAILKTQQTGLCKDIKIIINKLDHINGRVRVTEQKAMTNEARIKMFRWVIGFMITSGLAVGGFLFKIVIS